MDDGTGYLVRNNSHSGSSRSMALASSVSLSASTLYILPPELRQAIFGYSLFRDGGQNPPLLEALRCDPELYNEAVEVFNDINTFTLTRDKGWSAGRISKRACRHIQHLHIEFG